VALSPDPKIPFLADKAHRLTSGFCFAREPDLGGVGNGGVFRRRALLLRVQPKRFELPTPFRRSIAQPLDVDASRQTALDRSADELGSKESERDGHVDLTDAALLARCNLLNVSDGAGDNLLQPAPASCNRANQPEASFRPLWPDLASR
jgi:hypothetical protein